MNAFYLRWGVVVLVAGILAFLTYRHYDEHLATTTPEDVLTSNHEGGQRVLGLVKGGSLVGNVEQGQAQFTLSGEREELSVIYNGPPPENLRELKKVVLIGVWNGQKRQFHAHDVGLVTNYGYVMSAYFVGLLPLTFMVFVMGRKVTILYDEIKRSKLYQPE